MATPYLRRGIRLGDRPLTTTGVSFVSSQLRYNDYVVAAWMERTGTTPFTGASYHTAVLTYGYAVNKDIGFDDPADVITFNSGLRDATKKRGPRQTIGFTLQAMNRDELVEYERFYMLCGGSEQVIELVDEHSNAIPGRWVGGFKASYNSSNKARPWSLTITFELEHTSELYTYRSGGQVTS